ncbi:MAG: DUF5700 domain-containing putative Zn-dependent protease, partial [Gemmatimonadota bacterium]|nr:DUF5700 domain-containing putative Zn-dependent protease [Gemmatimonadota bacterium]
MNGRTVGERAACGRGPRRGAAVRIGARVGRVAAATVVLVVAAAMTAGPVVARDQDGPGAMPAPPASGEHLEVSIVTDEADAVLSILEKRTAGRALRQADWDRLFASEGYARLKAREQSMGRELDDSTFRAFVLSPDLARRGPALRRTLEAWTRIDPDAAAARAFAYLPAEARIHAKIYPVIKPATNSFVFELRTDPAIFLYLDPAVPPEKFENTLAHELHHVGIAGACPDEEDTTSPAPGVRAARRWMSGFAEGLAMLAAAGGPDIHPHATSSPAERAVWERDVAKAGEDLPRMEAFFRRLLDGELAGDADQVREGMRFINTDDVPQGAFYTLGWLMSAAVEREFGRERLVATLCDPAAFLAEYERAAERRGRKHGEALPRWSAGFLERVAREVSGPPPQEAADLTDAEGTAAYRLRIRIDPAEGHLAGEARIGLPGASAARGGPADTLVLLLHGELRVDSLAVGDAPADFTQEPRFYSLDYSLIANEIRIPLEGSDLSHGLYMRYSGPFHPSRARSRSDYMRI